VIGYYYSVLTVLYGQCTVAVPNVTKHGIGVYQTLEKPGRSGDDDEKLLNE